MILAMLMEIIMSNNYNVTKQLSIISDRISYELEEAILYMIEDAYGAPSFEEMTQGDIDHLVDAIGNEQDENLATNLATDAIIHYISVWYDNQ